MIGQEISPILKEIEDTLWFYEATCGEKPCYTDEGFRGACKIFISAVMDRMWELQEKESLDMEIREEMASRCGKEIKKLIQVYTDIDTYKMYKDER